MNLSSDCFIKIFFNLKTLTNLGKMAKETGFLSYCLAKCITCLLDRGYITTYVKLSGVPLNILSSVIRRPTGSVLKNMTGKLLNQS